MKITFLGTSHGYPEGNRKCSCTLLEIQGNHYLIDIGTMPEPELINRGIPIDSVKGIFVTHMHGDHLDGLPGFMDHLTWLYKTADPVICLPQIECVATLNDWMRHTLGRPMREHKFRRIEAGEIYDDGILKVTAIPTQHCALSYAFLLEAEGKRVVFTGDLRGPGVDFPQVALEQHLDLLVAEAAHFPITDYAPLLKTADIDSVIFHHYFLRRMDGFWQMKLDLEPLPVRLAHDGLEYTL